MSVFRLLGSRSWLSLGLGLLMAACGGGEAPGPSGSGSGSGSGGTATAASLQISLSATRVQTSSQASVDVTVTALDSSNRALSGVSLAVVASSGVLEIASPAVTDASGKVKGKFTLGQDRSNRIVTITASAGSVKTSEAIDVTGTTVSLTPSVTVVGSPADSVDLSATVLDATLQPISNALVTFNATIGTLSSQTAVTTASGKASVKLSGITGSTTVSAAGGGANSGSIVITTSNVSLPAVKPAGAAVTNLFVQANPGVIGPNTGASDANAAEIVVTVVGDGSGAKDVPIENAQVRMRVAGSPVPGRLAVDTSVSPALTNAAGQASNRFIAGAATTATDGVLICVKVEVPSSAAISATPGCDPGERGVRLTISQQPLFVKLSTNNLIASVDSDLNYQIQYGVLVTDAVGRGVANAVITPRLIPASPYAYALGSYVLNSSKWERVVPFYVCPNEDKNNNGVRDPGEPDYNGDGVLDPGQVASITTGSTVTTDATGFAVITLKYGKRYATWAFYQLQARALVGGTEGTAEVGFGLPAAESDITRQTPPPFSVSPFGNPSAAPAGCQTVN